MSQRNYFSVVIPVYNKQPHISRSIGSVLNQSFKNFELIIVDDGSTDGSLDEIKKFKDQRIKLLCNEKPTGPSAARNAGIRVAVGEWIAFLDADDEWDMYHLARVDKGIKKYPDVNVISCGWYISHGMNSLFPNTYFTQNSEQGEHLVDVFSYLTGRRSVWTSVAVVKKGLLANSGAFRVEYRNGEDTELWLRLFFIYNAKGLWLPYIGAIYHKDSVNMISKNIWHICSPIASMLKEYFKSNVIIDRKLELLVKKYANNNVFPLIKNMLLLKRCNRKYLSENLFWDALNCKQRLFFSIFGFASLGIQKKLAENFLK